MTIVLKCIYYRITDTGGHDFNLLERTSPKNVVKWHPISRRNLMKCVHDYHSDDTLLVLYKIPKPLQG